MRCSVGCIGFLGETDGITTYLQTQPFSPNRRRPHRGLLPGPTGAGFRSYTGAGTARPKDYWKSSAPCLLYTICGVMHQPTGISFEVQSIGAPSGRSSSASVQLPEIPSSLHVPGPLTLGRLVDREPFG